MTNEDKRQWVHFGVGAFALLLRYLTQWQAVGLAIVAVVFNSAVLPKAAPQLFRDSEKTKNFPNGIVAYPLTVLILILACPWSKKEIAAGAWAILAFGDSFSNLIGRRWGKWKLPWNRNKSYVGLIAFIVMGHFGGTLWMYWVNPTLGIPRIHFAAVIASIVAGIIESLNIPIDDNYTVGISAGLVLYFLI